MQCNNNTWFECVMRQSFRRFLTAAMPGFFCFAQDDEFIQISSASAVNGLLMY